MFLTIKTQSLHPVIFSFIYQKLRRSEVVERGHWMSQSFTHMTPNVDVIKFITFKTSYVTIVSKYFHQKK